MSNVIISVEKLGKKYRIVHQGERRHATLRETITENAKGLFKRLTLGSRNPGSATFLPGPASEEFWALKNVSLEVTRGEVLGIIGRNGAGKSTLLKILSRITEPTEGRVHLRGRIASLLEVGTGFHPELTGRENVYLNGAILGMSRVEIKSKFDEIVAFAEVERFLDTPVKRYSSGMYVRLAFAVAAHLEPEILVVDEVLAVGDAEFQKKCLGKMSSVAHEGRTVLFVSHNMAVVQRLCSKCALLADGRISFLGSTEEALHAYLNTTINSSSVVSVSEKQHVSQFNGVSLIRLKSVELLNCRSGQFAVRWREDIQLRLTLCGRENLSNVVFGISVATLEGVVILGAHSSDMSRGAETVARGEYSLEICLANPLAPGLYTIALGAHNAIGGDIIFLVPDAAVLEVSDVSVDELSYIHKHRVLVNTNASWKFEHE